MTTKKQIKDKILDEYIKEQKELSRCGSGDDEYYCNQIEEFVNSQKDFLLGLVSSTLAECEKEKEDWTWMYKGNQHKIWLNIYKNLRNWEKDGFQDPITYFTDGLNRWTALEIIKAKKECEKQKQKWIDNWNELNKKFGCLMTENKELEKQKDDLHNDFLTMSNLCGKAQDELRVKNKNFSNFLKKLKEGKEMSTWFGKWYGSKVTARTIGELKIIFDNLAKEFGIKEVGKDD